MSEFLYPFLERDAVVAATLLGDLAASARSKAADSDMLRSNTLDRLAAEVASSMIQQRERILDMSEEVLSGLVGEFCPPHQHAEEWDLDGIKAACKERFGFEPTIRTWGSWSASTAGAPSSTSRSSICSRRSGDRHPRRCSGCAWSADWPSSPSTTS